jgi:hypothetical protein
MAHINDIGTHGGFLAEEVLTATASSAIAATVIKPTSANLPAQSVLLTNNDATIVVRVRLSGTAATTATGHALKPGESIFIHGTDLIRRIRVIGESGSPLVAVTTFA